MSEFIINIIVLILNKTKVSRNNKLKYSYRHKIIDCINSCKTQSQLDSCKEMLDNTYKRFSPKDFADIRSILFNKTIDIM